MNTVCGTCFVAHGVYTITPLASISNRQGMTVLYQADLISQLNYLRRSEKVYLIVGHMD